MYGKLITLSALLAAVVCHDVTIGLSDGRKIYDEKIIASPAIWKQVQTITVNTTEGEAISRIVITDNRPYKDGSVEIIEGGEGQKNVTIEFKSPTVFRGMDFNVEVYAIAETDYVIAKSENNTQTSIGIDIQVNDNNTIQSGKTEGSTDNVISSTEATQVIDNKEVKTNIPMKTTKDSVYEDNQTNVSKTGPDSVVSTIFPQNTAEADKFPVHPSMVAQSEKEPNIVHTMVPKEIESLQTTKVDDHIKSSSTEQITTGSKFDRTTEETLVNKGQYKLQHSDITSPLDQKMSPIPYNKKY